MPRKKVSSAQNTVGNIRRRMCKKYSGEEKHRIVEESEPPIAQTLAELGVLRSPFYRWYQRYQAKGYGEFASQNPAPRRFWYHIPQAVCEQAIRLRPSRGDSDCYVSGAAARCVLC